MSNQQNDGNVNRQVSVIHRALERLADQIRVLYCAKVEVEIFPSNAMMLDIFYQDKLFVIAYSPSSGFGVDEIKEGEGFITSYNFYTDEIDLAEQQIYKLIEQL
jgi:hypothetical protein